MGDPQVGQTLQEGPPCRVCPICLSGVGGPVECRVKLRDVEEAVKGMRPQASCIVSV